MNNIILQVLLSYTFNDDGMPKMVSEVYGFFWFAFVIFVIYCIYVSNKDDN